MKTNADVLPMVIVSDINQWVNNIQLNFDDKTNHSASLELYELWVGIRRIYAAGLLQVVIDFVNQYEQLSVALAQLAKRSISDGAAANHSVTGLHVQQELIESMLTKMGGKAASCLQACSNFSDVLAAAQSQLQTRLFDRDINAALDKLLFHNQLFTDYWSMFNTYLNEQSVRFHNSQNAFVLGDLICFIKNNRNNFEQLRAYCLSVQR